MYEIHRVEKAQVFVNCFVNLPTSEPVGLMFGRESFTPFNSKRVYYIVYHIDGVRFPVPFYRALFCE